MSTEELKSTEDEMFLNMVLVHDNFTPEALRQFAQQLLGKPCNDGENGTGKDFGIVIETQLTGNPGEILAKVKLNQEGKKFVKGRIAEINNTSVTYKRLS